MEENEMLRKKITAWVLTAAMLTGLGAAAPVTAFAQTAEDVQQNRCYINGDEVRAYDVEDTIYVVVDDLSAYGFNVQKSKNLLRSQVEQMVITLMSHLVLIQKAVPWVPAA